MQNQANNSNSSLIIGVLIGSVAGMALGAAISSLANRFAGKAWSSITHRGELHEVDPRWMLQ